jgi:hypothetical protein
MLALSTSVFVWAHVFKCLESRQVTDPLPSFVENYGAGISSSGGLEMVHNDSEVRNACCYGPEAEKW